MTTLLPISESAVVMNWSIFMRQERLAASSLASLRGTRPGMHIRTAQRYILDRVLEHRQSDNLIE